jgi:hypothetical protein
VGVMIVPKIKTIVAIPDLLIALTDDGEIWKAVPQTDGLHWEKVPQYWEYQNRV